MTTYRQLLGHARPSLPWTNVVSQRVGAAAGVVAVRRGTHPSTLTMMSLGVGLATAGLALFAMGQQPWIAGVVAFVGWQLSYGLDCADGQVARATGTATDAGARLDVTADFATSLAIGCVLAVPAHEAGVPTVLVVAAAAAWVFPVFDEISGRGGDADVQTVDRSSASYRLLGVVRDGGSQKAIAAVGLGFGPRASTAVLLAMGTVLIGLLATRIVFLARRSSRVAG